MSIKLMNTQPLLHPAELLPLSVGQLLLVCSLRRGFRGGEEDERQEEGATGHGGE